VLGLGLQTGLSLGLVIARVSDSIYVVWCKTEKTHLLQGSQLLKMHAPLFGQY